MKQDVIDFVIPWVDDTDELWLKKKAEFTGQDTKIGNCEARYRDWDTLKYWFRGVEKFAPWVRHIYFISDNQKPEWLNTEHPKLKWIKHSDYIERQYLPTFSSHTIEWNLHRIEGLSENFVYFNDDVFLINHTKPTDFFVDGKPCDLPCLGPLYPNGFFSYILFNNINLLNRHFSLKNSVRNNLMKWIKHQPIEGLAKLPIYARRDLIPNSVSHHIHTSFNKKTFNILWKKEKDLVHKTCLNKIRAKEDLSIYTVRDWQIFSGEFHPKKPIGKQFDTASLSYSNEAVQYLRRQKGKIICLNDSEDETEFQLHKQIITEELEKLLPKKSDFEL